MSLKSALYLSAISLAAADLEFFEPFSKPSLDGWKATNNLSTACFEHSKAMPTGDFILSSGRNMGGVDQGYFNHKEVGIKAPETLK